MTRKLIYFLMIMTISFSSILTAKTVVGVTKFKNITNNKKIKWLGIGIADAITQKLTMVKDFIVVDRTNVERIIKEIQLGQQGLVDESSAKSIGKALGADVIVIGNYAKYGNRVRISARLVEVESHKVVKLVQATGKMDNIFELQDEIAIKLIDNSKVSISDKERNRIKDDNKKIDLSAYEYYSKGLKFYMRQDYINAIKMFQKAVGIDNKYSLAYTSLSKSYAKYYWQKWKIFEQEKDVSLTEKSYKYAKKALSLTPDSDAAHISLARYYIYVDSSKVKNKWDMCKKEAKKAIAINPNNAEGYYLLSRLNPRSKEEYYLNKSIEKNKFFADAYLQLGILNNKRKKYDKAEANFKRVIQIEPRHVLGYSWLGYMYNRIKKPQKAIDLYLKLLEKYPDYVYGIRGLGIYYRDTNQLDMAMEQFKKILRLRKKDYKALYEIGNINQKRKLYKQAIRYYKKSLKQNKYYYYSLANMGYSLTQLGKYSVAIRFLEKAHYQNRKKSWAAGYLGWLYNVKLENRKKAIYWYKRALKREPNSSSYRNSLNKLQGGSGV